MNDDDKLTQDARRRFDASVEQLDAATLSKLNRGRHAALAAARPGARRQYWGLTLGGASAAAVLIGLLLRAPAVDVIDAPAADIDLLQGEDSIEMLEDLEFYRWLDDADAGVRSNDG